MSTPIKERPHVVYRLLGKRDRVLYIGCSSNLSGRMVDHRRNCLFGHLIAKVEEFGPYSYEEARRIERVWIEELEPPYNIEWTRRHQRGLPYYKQRRSAA